MNSTINAVFRPERRRFVDWLRVFTLFTLAAIWLARPVITQQFGSIDVKQEELAAVREQFVTQFVVADFDSDGNPDSGFQAGAAPQVLFLNRANEGQSVSAKVGQSIVITLQTIGPGQYGAPQVSSQSIRFESSSFPAKQNPGGPTQVYRFTAVAEGEAKIEITHSDGKGTFELTIQVARQIR